MKELFARCYKIHLYDLHGTCFIRFRFYTFDKLTYVFQQTDKNVHIFLNLIPLVKLVATR